MREEFALIERLKAIAGPPGPGVVVGIGDDAAVLESLPGRNLATVDRQVEGIHFDLSWITPEELGHRALAVNLSDIAAMGGTPRFALVSLGVRDGLGVEFFERAYRGLMGLARRYGVQVVGGNVSRSPERLHWDVTVLGHCAGEPKLRSGARVGHKVWVTGPLGRAAAGLAALKREGAGARRTHADEVRAFLTPEPRVHEGIRLGATPEVGACIDLSDGLPSEVHHLARASGVGFHLAGELPPTGEDYELLFTAPGPVGECHCLGVVVPAAEGITFNGRPLPDGGWDHLETQDQSGS